MEFLSKPRNFLQLGELKRKIWMNSVVMGSWWELVHTKYNNAVTRRRPCEEVCALPSPPSNWDQVDLRFLVGVLRSGEAMVSCVGEYGRFFMS